MDRWPLWAPIHVEKPWKSGHSWPRQVGSGESGLQPAAAPKGKFVSYRRGGLKTPLFKKRGRPGGALHGPAFQSGRKIWISRHAKLGPARTSGPALLDEAAAQRSEG